MITTSTQWVFQIVIAVMTPPLLASIGWATYILFGICCFVSFIWIAFFVPETRGVSVGQSMDALFSYKNNTREAASHKITETTALLAS
jgi:hypothetical protein